MSSNDDKKEIRGGREGGKGGVILQVQREQTSMAALLMLGIIRREAYPGFSTSNEAMKQCSKKAMKQEREREGGEVR